MVVAWYVREDGANDEFKDGSCWWSSPIWILAIVKFHFPTKGTTSKSSRVEIGGKEDFLY